MDNGGEIMHLCRLCLVKDQVNIPIFEDQGDIRQIFQKISSCLPVKVARDDRLPKKICDGCSYKLDIAYELHNSSTSSEKKLLTWLGIAGLNSKVESPDNVSLASLAQQIKSQPSDMIVKQEALDDHDNNVFVEEMKYSNNWGDGSGPSVDEPPPKRARRAAAVRASLNVSAETDDDDDDLDNEPLANVSLSMGNDDDDDDDNEDNDASFNAPSTSADDQPGPSGVGKDGAEAP